MTDERPRSTSAQSRRIGLIGGMSWESTALYYRLLNEGVRERVGGHHSVDLVLRSIDFAPIVAMQQAGDWPGAATVLADAARDLEAAGAELIMIGANTMHRVAPEVEAAVSVPLLHVVDVVADAALERGIPTIGLLGTRYTMGDPFYSHGLAARGVSTLVPHAADRELVNSIIYDELVHGRFTDEARASIVTVIESLRAQGARGVVLGCTELELLINSDDVDVPLFATTALHSRAALAAAFAD
ncbi:aspartate/glutamate racemase family protein [Propionibacteriaceae bacterium Y2011]|uniref:aspartate/glutamate racemase family protein n=1 Tax=Microlunatus sp. Y2014 TaxID=3418488 RepID=UPI003B48F9CB